ncbi:Outer membrane lipoprotein-sorting protein [Arboricoccus pini]|uniref:Outer membrane lipoprotein-sorting protein n=1 Tax=Arboricoccus pini TaxID=1963835 RepID=A0A212R927_9PROT|nr:outer membrane lipoprotein carrier protein LolA [Arboricoccus pini]SNB68540.1 Outer membrane lipoprotein-sorting protein [Arboricoccus pini]
MSAFDRRFFLGSSAAGLLTGLLAQSARAALPPSDQSAVNAVESYLDGIKTLQARFQQINPNGGMAAGTVYISRPGKMRLDYDPPSKITLVATDWRLIFQDAAVKQVNQIPLSQTPLAFLLASQVDLNNSVEVEAVQHVGNEVGVKVIQKDKPDQGNVIVYFAQSPMELRRWTVTDPQGLVTQVVLADIKTGVTLDPDLFHWRDPKLFGWPSD